VSHRPWIFLKNADHWRVRFGTDEQPLEQQWSERNDWRVDMGTFTIRQVDEAKDCCCPKCGERYDGRRGLRLFAEDHERPVCRACGKKLAPTMVALLDLAHAAERVGRSGRRLLTPPMESLLDLARAAENYSCAAPARRVS
jgi:hypothetical protein